MKRSGVLLMGLAVALILLLAPGVQAAESREPADAVWFEVKGNAKGFRTGTWRKNKAVTLADCVVRRIHILDTARAVPDEYMNQETMQKLFDTILAAEVVRLSERQEADWRRIGDNYLGYIGLMMVCESPNGSNLYSNSKGTMFQKPGQGYADLTLSLIESQEAYFENIVCVRAQVYIRNATKGNFVFVRSEELYDLSKAICKQDAYTTQELTKSWKVGWDDYQKKGKNTKTYTEDEKTIAKLIEVLTSGEREYNRIEMIPINEFEFFMPDNRMLTANIVLVRLGEEGEERQYYLRTPDALYRVDLQAVNDVLSSAGLHEIEG